MARLVVDNGDLVLRFSRLERLGALHGDLRVALGATEEAARLYAARGWKLWQGSLSAITLEGVRPTPEEQGSVYVFEHEVALDVTGELCCDWRDGDVW